MIALGAGTPAVSVAQDKAREPVEHVAPDSIAIAGGARLALFASQDLARKGPAVTRAVVVVHGLNRNAEDYFAAVMQARQQAGSSALVVAPQFLADFDVPAHALPASTLAWRYNRWARGAEALAPAPVSTFEALDALVASLADPGHFPAMRTVVVAGFSAGGQLVQRYAAVGHADAHVPATVAVEYLVSDPSSFLYFSPQRPLPAIAAACPGFDAWHYGFAGGAPSYVTASAADAEARYVARHVTYLIGMADTDPDARALDRSCAGEAEGPQRFARAHAYWDWLAARHPAGFNHVLIDVPGIAHQGARMFRSDCGRHVLFGVAGCGP